ncbi:MAG: hypothetical protein IPM07_00345 [Anaerolineales bacterium]|nr:hypothetical protein [Anaerolineales bacterium]
MSITVRPIRWQGCDAWALESAQLRVVTIPALGAKVVSLLDKRSGREWLAGPGDRPLRAIAYGASFQEQDVSGWDEMFPTIVACAYPGPVGRTALCCPTTAKSGRCRGRWSRRMKTV